MAVTLGDSPDGAAGWTRTLVPADGAQFPAVSEDGKVMVELFHDRIGTNAQPMATVVLFSRMNRAVSTELRSDTTDSRAQRRLERSAVAAINERLSRARWRPLAVATPCQAILHDAVTAALGDGVTVMVAGRAISVARDGVARPMHSAVPDLLSCDRYAVLDRAFGSRAIGFVVVVLRNDAPDDSCRHLGSPTAALAIPVLIP